MLDVFNNNAFSVTSLTDAMREIKYVPSLISSLGLFTPTYVRTTSVAIEKDKDQNIIIVPQTARGSHGTTWDKRRRTMTNLTIPHFQVDDGIYADEVQNVRQFGEEEGLQMLSEIIAERAAEASAHFALTEEYHRLSVVTQGKLLDADGSVIFDYATQFGEVIPTEVDWDLDAANPSEGVLRGRAAKLVRDMGTAAGGLPVRGILALAGDAFYDALLAHKEVRDTYKNIEAAQTLRQAYVPPGNSSVDTGIWSSIDLFNIRWLNYRGGLGVSVDTNKAKFIPLGVPNLFRSVYAPADYIETVNRLGQRLYARQWEMENGKGYNLEFQSNVLHYMTRPRLLFSARMT